LWMMIMMTSDLFDKRTTSVVTDFGKVNFSIIIKFIRKSNQTVSCPVA